MVFDMIANAPGVLNSTLRLGAAAGSDRGGRRSVPDAVAQSDRVRLQAAARRPVERRHSAQADRGSHPRRRLRRLQVDRPAAAGADQRACRLARRSCRRTRIRPVSRARCRDRRRCRTTSCGRTRATAASGCGTTAAMRNYKALQTSVTRRFDRGFMFSGFWVWSKAQGINSTDFAAGVPNLTEEQTRAPRLLAAGLRPDAQLHGQRHLPDAEP